MTTTTNRTGRAGGASPVDFEAYGDYGGRPKAVPKQPEAGAKQARPAEFSRPAYRFQGRITADGSSGHPAQAGRYHLYISWACPWAHRTAIVRKLLGLEDVVSLSAVDPVRDGRGWAFREGDGHGLDPVNGFSFLREAYDATEPGYDGHISVPVLWDRQVGRIVSNNFPDITIDLETQFARWADPGMQLYPAALRPEIDEINELVYTSVNNGVYRSGFAQTQQAYHEAVTAIFAALDQLEERLAGRRYLMGPALTEADVRLWVTLARFDAVYYSHFKANLRRITDYQNLWGYARDLYAIPAFRETTNFDHIKRHYYTTHGAINPTRIVPDGPLLDWDSPHGRQPL
ncbi:MAG TPA: glutathione S-transferase C-terminal domain-containing protein [Streptosporangiaceae bacterium]|nr:glutathione S-transferase C-terminal domain-containing protein [Streptosporangiaceae bacterium]